MLPPGPWEAYGNDLSGYRILGPPPADGGYGARHMIIERVWDREVAFLTAAGDELLAFARHAYEHWTDEQAVRVLTPDELWLFAEATRVIARAVFGPQEGER